MPTREDFCKAIWREKAHGNVGRYRSSKFFIVVHIWQVASLLVFDACIVIISFSLDVFMLVNKEEGALSGVEFIILLRLWRISRIVNGIIISVKRKTEEKTELLRIQRDEIQEQVSKLEFKLTAQTKEIQHLRAKLEALGVLPDDRPQP